MLFTRHAKERLKKRLAKRGGRLERIYSELWAFLDRSKRIDVNEKITIFTDGRKSLVCTRLDCERLQKSEILERVRDIMAPTSAYISMGGLRRLPGPKSLLRQSPPMVNTAST